MFLVLTSRRSSACACGLSATSRQTIQNLRVSVIVFPNLIPLVIDSE